MKLTKPLFVDIDSSEKYCRIDNEQLLTISPQASWQNFQKTINSAKKQLSYDYVILQRSDKDDSHLKSMSIELRSLSKGLGVPVFDHYKDNYYLLNASYKDTSKATVYAPADSDILNKYESYGDEANWQAHQSQIWDKMKATNGLNGLNTKVNQYKIDHKAILEAPSRGLEDEDMSRFWSWQKGLSLSPSLYDDDFLGMPGVVGHIVDYQLYMDDSPVTTQPTVALSTTGPSGYVIPLINPRGDMPKFQIGTDVTAYSMTLKARAGDGVAIKGDEYYDKKSRTYMFELDGEPSQLKITQANDSEVVLEDIKGTFTAKPKEDIVNKLIDRGYDIPDIIDNLKPIQSGKYMWPGNNSMTGSRKVADIVSPSVPGMIVAREPKNGADSYVGLVAEGALKGVITAKYADKPTRDGISFADRIAGNRGVVVFQTTGVAQKFFDNIANYIEETDLKIDGTYIALDADGRTNQSVASGIHYAQEVLSQHSPTAVLAWNPEQKGIDDALIALSRKEIGLNDLDIHFGDAQTLFPLDKATQPVPYLLNGKRAFGNQPEWMREYAADKARRNTKLDQARADTEELMGDELARAVDALGDNPLSL